MLSRNSRRKAQRAAPRPAAYREPAVKLVEKLEHEDENVQAPEIHKENPTRKSPTEEPILAAIQEAMTRPERGEELWQVLEELIRKNSIDMQGYVTPGVEEQLAAIREILAEERRTAQALAKTTADLKASIASLSAEQDKMLAEVSILTEAADELQKAGAACLKGFRAVTSDPRWAYVF